LFGDGVYEVIPSYYGHLFHLEEHLERLENSLAAIRLVNPHSRSEWREIFTSLLDASQNQYVYLQLTRGVAPKRDHAFPEAIAPTVFAMVSAIVPFAGKYTGIQAVTMDDSRWKLCHAKAITLLANILHRQSAIDQDAAEAILIKDNYVTEGAASNVFVVLDGSLLTPPKGNEILPGITRDVILDLARKNNLRSAEQHISAEQLSAASEIWVTSSTREIIPVVTLDGKPVGTGNQGQFGLKWMPFFKIISNPCYE